MDKIRKAWKALREFGWILQAYCRGKILRQKQYRPRANFFWALEGASPKRMIRLMRWWGYRPATMEELLKEFNFGTLPEKSLNPLGQVGQPVPPNLLKYNVREKKWELVPNHEWNEAWDRHKHLTLIHRH